MNGGYFFRRFNYTYNAIQTKQEMESFSKVCWVAGTTTCWFLQTSNGSHIIARAKHAPTLTQDLFDNGMPTGSTKHV